PALAVERRRPQVVQAEAELLVLGADAPVRARAFAAGQVFHQLVAAGDRGVGDVAGTRQGWHSRGGNCRDPALAGTGANYSVPRRTPMSYRWACSFPWPGWTGISCRHATAPAAPQPPARTAPYRPGGLVARG